MLMNSQTAANTTGPVTKPAVTQSSNNSTDQGINNVFAWFENGKIVDFTNSHD